MYDDPDTKIYVGSMSDPISDQESPSEEYSSEKLIALEADSEFIFMVKDDGSNEEEIVYFTAEPDTLKQGIIYNSRWLGDQF